MLALARVETDEKMGKENPCDKKAKNRQKGLKGTCTSKVPASIGQNRRYSLNASILQVLW